MLLKEGSVTVAGVVELGSALAVEEPPEPVEVDAVWLQPESRRARPKKTRRGPERMENHRGTGE